jgi:hypothetical protein
VRYEVVAGPRGLAVDGGVFGGSPLQTGVFAFSLRSTDGVGCIASQAVTLTSACPAVMVSPATVATLTTGAAMTPVQFTLAGSTAPNVDTLLSGALPIGVSFADGGLSGVPTLDGTYPVMLSAMDSFGCAAMAQLQLTVVRSATFQPTTLALSTPFHKWHSFKRHVGRSCCATTLKAVFLRAATPPDRARFEVEVENFVFGGDIPAAVLWPLAMHGPFFSKAAGPATP